MDRTPEPLSDPQAAAAVELLHEAAFAYLAMVEPEGPYVLPLSFVYVDGGAPPLGAGAGVEGPAAGRPAPRAEGGPLTGRVYFHTGEGRKTAALAADQRVCLAVTSEVTFSRGGNPCGDGFLFRSLLLWGRARRIEDAAGREAALRAIVAKYDPDSAAKPFGKAVYARTVLFEMTIEAAGYKQRPWETGG